MNLSALPIYCESRAFIACKSVDCLQGRRVGHFIFPRRICLSVPVGLGMEKGSGANSTWGGPRSYREGCQLRAKKVHWSSEGSGVNSTWEGPRSYREGCQSRAKKVHWSSEVGNTQEKTPESNSSAMVNQKKGDSISSHSGGSYKSHRWSGVEAPSKQLQTINETSKVRFLTTEEVIKRASCIEAPTSSHVKFPAERGYLASSRGSPIVDKAHAPKSSALPKISTPVAYDSRQSSSSNQHQAFWRSGSTENEDAPPGFSVNKSTAGGISTPRPSGAENNPRKQLPSDGYDERDSRLGFSVISSESGPNCALKDVPPRNTAPAFRKRKFHEKFSGAEVSLSRMDTEHGDSGLDAALSEELEGSCKKHEGSGTDVPPRNTAHAFRKRTFQEEKFSGTEVSLSRMNTEHEDSGLDAALSEELEGSCKKHEGGGTDAVMPEKLDGPNRRTNLVNDPAGVKFGPSADCNVGQERNGERNLQYPQEGPAYKFIWRENFEVVDIESNVKHYERFSVHPSTRISRKAFNLAKQIDRAIQFVMHPRHDFWPVIFQTDCPDRNDIALYFYPGRHERSKRKYSLLLKHIEKENMMLRSQIGNIDLLVFGSKLLPEDAQKLNGSYFMWGVFLPSKRQ